jgi:hypothetical protein
MSCINYNNFSNFNTCTLNALGPDKEAYSKNGFKRIKDEKIKFYDSTDDVKSSIYSLCELQNDSYKGICPLQKQNPWFQYDAKKNICTANIDNNIIIPQEIISNNLKEHNENYVSFKKSQIFSYRISQGTCENNWYDWFTIPNYHLNNYYEKDAGFGEKDEKGINIYKCYKPCNRLFLPIINNEKQKVCVPKMIANGGMYKNTIDFSPLALVILLGSIPQDLYDHFNTLKDNSIKKSSGIYNIDDKINEKINAARTTIVNSAINIIRESVNKNILINNNLNSTEQNFSDDNKKNFENAVLTYATESFMAPDVNIQESMHNIGLFNKEYLNTCYKIAYFTHKETIGKFKSYCEDFNSFKNTYNTTDKNTINNILSETPNYNYNIHYRIANLFNLSLDDATQIKKIKRLANIFKKASNICFDGETSFSKYIIENITYKPVENQSAKILLYEFYHLDPEFDMCKSNQKNTYDPETRTYKCVKNNSNSDEIKIIPQDTTRTIKEIHQSINPSEFSKQIPDFLKLFFDSYYYLNILFIILILILIDILTDGFVAKMLFKLLNFVYKLILSIFVFIWDLQYLISGTVIARFEKDVAEYDWSHAYEQEKNIMERVSKFDNKGDT